MQEIDRDSTPANTLRFKGMNDIEKELTDNKFLDLNEDLRYLLGLRLF